VPVCLDEVIPFLEEAVLAPGQHGRTSGPGVRRAGHPVGALRSRPDRSLAIGVHILPLIGTGDWNDGLNRVGPEGRGECVAGMVPARPLEFARWAMPGRTCARDGAVVDLLGPLVEEQGVGGGLVSSPSSTDGTSRVRRQREVPHRFDRPVMGRDLRRRRAKRAARAMAVEEYLVRRGQELVLCYAAFDRALSTPVTSRLTPGVREKTAASTRTPPSGP
jgi:cyclic beta-1,2-glucan synthetase